MVATIRYSTTLYCVPRRVTILVLWYHGTRLVYYYVFFVAIAFIYYYYY